MKAEKTVGITMEVKHTCVLYCVDVYGESMGEALERAKQMISDDEETIGELANSEGTWSLKCRAIGAAPERSKPLKHGFWDIRID